MLKKITIAIWFVTALLLAILLVNYYSNRQFIKNYDSGVYQENELGFLGFTQPYIDHFNKGNLYFRLRNHTKAKQQYQQALNLKPEDPYDCKIRVNYALAYVEPINVKKITKDNYQDTIKICETAKSILAENKCATEDNKGHYYAAQKLYNEINAFIEELRNQFENPTPTPTPPEDQPQPTRDPNDPTPSPTPTSKPDGDETPTPTPSATPTSNPGQDQATPTPTPNGGQATPTPTPGDGQDTPTPSPGGDSGTPSPTPGGDSGTPSPTPGGDNGTGTPTPTPGGDNGTGTPTPTSGGTGNGTPTPTPGDDGGNDPDGGEDGNGPQKPMTPEEKIKDIQNRANKVRGGDGGNSGKKTDYNYGDSASW